MAKKKKQKQKKLPPKKTVPIARMPVPVTQERIEEVILGARPCGNPGKSQLIAPDPQASSNALHPEETKGLVWLRFAAGLHYTTDMRGATLEQMSKHPLFGKVTLNTLAHWSSQDRWVERRQQNLDRWRQLIESKIGSELVKARMTQLNRMRTVFDRMMNQLEKKGKGALQAKSFEGMVSALVKLADLMDDWNEKLFRAVIPDIPNAPSEPLMLSGAQREAKPRLSKEESRAAAGEILRMRRDELRRKADEAAGQPPPPLKVIEGER